MSDSIVHLINKIVSEVEISKKVNRKDAWARIGAADKLVKRTKEDFEQLKRILPVTDSQYQMIADKLGLEIMQCGIDYFNNSNDNNAARIAMGWQKYAQSIVVGTIAKQRCDENVRILQKMIDELPPCEIIAEDKAIKAEYSSFRNKTKTIENAVSLLVNTEPYLQSIRQKIGVSNPYYIKLSTQIVAHALNSVMNEVNSLQNNPKIVACSELGTGLDSSSVLIIKSVLSDALYATSLMDKYYMDSDFIPVYEERRDILYKMHSRIYKEYVRIKKDSTEWYLNTVNSNSTTSVYHGCFIGIGVMFAISTFGAMINGFSGWFWGLVLGGFIGVCIYKLLENK